MSKSFLIVLTALTFTACSGSYVGVPNAKSITGAGAVTPLYQLMTIYATAASSNANVLSPGMAAGSTVTTYSDAACPTSACTRTSLAVSCNGTSCSPTDAFQLVTNQGLMSNINTQLAGTISECPSTVTIPSSVDAAAVAAAVTAAGISMDSRSIATTPTPASTGQYYFLSLGASSAVGIVADSNFKAICKMSFTFAVSDSTTTPVTQQLTPESTYDASYGYLVQDLPAAQLAPDTYLIVRNGGKVVQNANAMSK